MATGFIKQAANQSLKGLNYNSHGLQPMEYV